MTRVLVTGARAPVALDLAGSFRAAGCTVALADSVRPFAATLARPRFTIHRFPPPRFAFAAFRAALRELVSRYDLVVPTCEEVFWLAAAAERDGWSDRLYAPAFAHLAQLHSKARFPAFAQSLGIATPATTTLASRADVERLTPEDALVVKPEFSRFGTRTLVAPNARALATIIPTRTRRWVAQERIVGKELCAWSALLGGRVVASAIYRPLLRHGRAAAYAFEAVDHTGVSAMLARVAGAVGGDGQLAFDVIVTPEGRIAPIECNPRAISGVHLFDGAPALARAVLGGGPVTPAPGTIRYLGPAMTLLGLPAALAGRDLARWRAVDAVGTDVIGRMGGRGATAGVLLDAARFALLGLSRFRTPTGETTDDIEWNGEVMA